MVSPPDDGDDAAGGNGQREDIAASAALLLSDEASCISGQVLEVDGGWSASRDRAPEA
jgi:enoyl-[acyl-carrier-protein] reductase (NADH)